MKTSELKGVALDWAVAKCSSDSLAETVRKDWRWRPSTYSPSTNWKEAGPIIYREKIDIMQSTGRICAAMWEDLPGGGRLIAEMLDCPHPLIAAMRCYVASKLGDEIEIPKELSNERTS